MIPYEIDMVSDFTYFENVLLGLADALQKCVGVKRTYLRKVPPLILSEILEWEILNRVKLVSNFYAFFLSSNGYHFEWTYTFAGDDENETTVGMVHINCLDKMIQVYGYETTNNPGVKFDGKRYVIKLAPESKIFEISPLPGHGRIVLIYLYPNYEPKIWLMKDDMTFYYLAKDLVTYLRMSVAHLGIPNWQLRYTQEGLPQWSENMFYLLIPRILYENNKPEMFVYDRKEKSDDRFFEVPLNKLDPAVFDERNYLFTPRLSKMEIAMLEPEKLEVQQPEKLEKAMCDKPKLCKKKVQKQKKKSEKSTKPVLINSLPR